MGRVRKVEGFDPNWMTRVEAGETIACFKSEYLPKRTARRNNQKTIVINSARSLKNMGELLTVKEVAKILRVTDRAVYGWIDDGKLKAYHAGRSIRIASLDVEELICA